MFTLLVSFQIRDELSNASNASSAETRHIPDGSKTDQGTGSAAFINDQRQAFLRLSEPCDVFTAELTAIALACELIEDSNEGQFDIASDSMSALSALLSRKLGARKTDLFYKCKMLLHVLGNSGRPTSLIWVPANRGIPGNEDADTLAKRATTFNRFSEEMAEWQHFAPSCVALALSA